MNDQIDTRTIVLLAAGGAAAYVAFRSPALGAAILVGVGVVALLWSITRP